MPIGRKVRNETGAGAYASNGDKTNGIKFESLQIQAWTLVGLGDYFQGQVEDGIALCAHRKFVESLGIISSSIM